MRYRFAIALCTASALAAPAHAWWDPAWTARQQLRFLATDIPIDQDDITVLVRLDPSRIDYAALRADGADLRFVDADDATELLYDVERWNPGGESLIWVRVPRIDAQSDTDTIWMYYGNPAAPPGDDGAAAYVSAVQRLVWHFDANPPVNTIDGLASSNSGSTRVNGLVGKARQFDGSNDYLSHATPLSDWLDQTAVLSFLIQTTDSGNDDETSAVALTGDRRGNDTASMHVWGYLDGSGAIGFRVGTTVAVGTTPVNDGAWHHVALQRNGANGTMEVFVDGAREAVVTGGATGVLPPANAFDQIGRVVGGASLNTRHLDAIIDELRIANTLFTEGSHRARYKSVTDQLIEFCAGTLYFPDDDGDGYGDPARGEELCVPPAGYVALPDDCDDADPTVNPGAVDLCDDDGDGIGDGIDRNCDGVGGPDDDSDGDGLTWAQETPVGGNDCTTDTDGDSVPDSVEIAYADTDGDGVWNIADPDDDGDGIATSFEGTVDTDADCNDPDGIPNYLDLDSNNNGNPDADEGMGDYDGDGIPDFLDCEPTGCGGDQDGDGLSGCVEQDLGTFAFDPDTDGDGANDLVELGCDVLAPAHRDTDGDGVEDAFDEDDDGDGVPTRDEGPPAGCAVDGQDTDGDGVDDFLDPDDDGDGLATILEDPNGDGVRSDDSDGDGLPDFLDDDDDGDGVPTAAEDRDGDGDWFDDDIDGDALPDYLDPDDADGPLADTDGDGLTNDEEAALGTDPLRGDTDGDGLSDADEAPRGDSDGDGLPDPLDPDDDDDGIPTRDEGVGDPDGDGIPNYLDDDSDGDGTPDFAEGPLADEDCDGLPDFLDDRSDLGCDPPPDGPRAVIRYTPGCDHGGTGLPAGWIALLALLAAVRAASATRPGRSP